MSAARSGLADGGLDGASAGAAGARLAELEAGPARGADGDDASARTRARAGRRRRLWVGAALAGVVLAALGLRLAYRIDYAEEVDSIRFIEAVADFDVAARRPHFPGYPVFIALGKLAAWGGGLDGTAALALVCAVCGALLVLAAALLARRLWGATAGWVAALLVALNPMLWLYSTKILSDTPGLLFLFCSLALLVAGLDGERERGPRQRRLVDAGLVLLGLTLGVRLSYLPFVFSALLLVAWRGNVDVGEESPRSWSLLRATLLIGLASLTWAVPMVVFGGGAEALLAAGGDQISGHFTRWGGSVLTQGDVGLRLKMLVWQMTAHGLGAWWVDRSALYLVPTVGLLSLLLGGATAWVVVRRRRSREGARSEPARGTWMLWLALFVPYLLWAFLAQNITVKPRHALPLVVLLLVAIAGLAGRVLDGGPRWVRALVAAGALLWLGGQAASGFTLAREHRDTPSNAVRLARAVAKRCAQGAAVVVYTPTFKRHIQRHAPCAAVVVVRRINHARRDLARRPGRPLGLVISDVARVDRLHSAPLFAYRRSRYIQNARHDVALYAMGARR